MGEPWNSNFCGCYAHCPVCCVVWCLPGSAVAVHLFVAAEVQESCMIPYCLFWYLDCYGLALNRMKFREYHNIQGNYCLDCLAWYFCPCLSAIQEYRESLSRYRNCPRVRQIPSQVVVIANSGQMPINVAFQR